MYGILICRKIYSYGNSCLSQNMTPGGKNKKTYTQGLGIQTNNRS